jgi:hypothetical protein
MLGSTRSPFNTFYAQWLPPGDAQQRRHLRRFPRPFQRCLLRLSKHPQPLLLIRRVRPWAFGGGVFTSGKASARASTQYISRRKQI